MCRWLCLLLAVALCGCSGVAPTPNVDATACVQEREALVGELARVRATVEAQRVWGTEIPVLETLVANLELDLGTAVAMATRCQPPPAGTAETRTPVVLPTSRPAETGTPMPLPTGTAETLPGLLCRPCASDGDCRPEGSGSTMFCRDCLGATGKRCVSRESPSGDCTTCRNVLGFSGEAGMASAKALVDLIRNEAWKVRGVPYNPDAAFQAYARVHGLGAPNTVEFDVEWEADGVVWTARVQGFDRGIVWCMVQHKDNNGVVVVDGRWEETAHLDW